MELKPLYESCGSFTNDGALMNSEYVNSIKTLIKSYLDAGHKGFEILSVLQSEIHTITNMLVFSQGPLPKIALELEDELYETTHIDSPLHDDNGLHTEAALELSHKFKLIILAPFNQMVELGYTLQDCHFMFTRAIDFAHCETTILPSLNNKDT